MSSSTVKMKRTLINAKWTLKLPEHLASLEHWGMWGDGRYGWKVERLDSMSVNTQAGDIIYDIGSEEGDLSALYASWIQERGGGGGVCLFEPDTRVWPNIKAIWEANKLPTPLSKFPGFAGRENRELTTVHYSSWPPTSEGPIISDHHSLNLCDDTTTPSIRLDDFVMATGYLPTIVTIDVEGAEFEVIQGCINILKDIRPLLYLSIHPSLMKEKYRSIPMDIHELLAAFGYREKKLAVDEEEHWVFFHPFGPKDFVF